ncbi:MAG TPA: hypothetical protein PLF29_02975, partial [bacterium]|nr:hypothetical protein [bacterium]
VGRVGALYFERLKTKKTYKYFDLPDVIKDQNLTEGLFEYLSRYDAIIVHHGRYENILNQEPVSSSISGDALRDRVVGEGAEEGLNLKNASDEKIAERKEKSNTLVTSRRRKLPETRYLFEPSLLEVVKYFEFSILELLFNQAIQESNLSKYASRMIGLNASSDRIQKKLGSLHNSLMFEKHRAESKKQLNKLSAVYGRVR